MKLVDIKTKKLFLQYLAEFITKKVNLDEVCDIITRQKYVNNLHRGIANNNIASITANLSFLNRLNGKKQIKEVYETVKDEEIKKRFQKYI
jgi:hypothetical protein